MKIYLYICLVLYLLSPVYSQSLYQCSVNQGANQCTVVGKNKSVCPSINACMYWVNQIKGLRIDDEVAINVAPGENKYCLGNVQIPFVKSISFYSIGEMATYNCNTEAFVKFSTNHPTNITFQNIEVIGNQDYQDGYGGAVFASYDVNTEFPTISFTQCKFSNFSSTVAGGLIYTNGYNVIIESSSFVNGSSAAGGAIAAYGSVQLTIDSSSFWINNASQGGAIFTTASSIQISYSEFTENYGTYGGGAIYSSYSGLVSIESTTFTGNSAPSGVGGAIYSENSASTIDKSNFLDNKAQTDGGAVYGGGYLITSTNFGGNSAISGGAVYSYGPLKLLDSNIVNSNAIFGGALYITESLEMQSTELLRSNASRGGAIFLDVQNSFANIYDSLIFESTASFGGAIFTYSEIELNLLGTKIQANIASESAGGIYFMNEYPQNFITGGLFVQNMCADLSSDETFNTEVMPETLRYVYVDNSYMSGSYITPIVDDTTSLYLRAYGVSGQECLNGFATLNNSTVIGCSCFSGFSGPTCS